MPLLSPEMCPMLKQTSFFIYFAGWHFKYFLSLIEVWIIRDGVERKLGIFLNHFIKGKRPSTESQPQHWCCSNWSQVAKWHSISPIWLVFSLNSIWPFSLTDSACKFLAFIFWKAVFKTTVWERRTIHEGDILLDLINFSFRRLYTVYEQKFVLCIIFILSHKQENKTTIICLPVFSCSTYILYVNQSG